MVRRQNWLRIDLSTAALQSAFLGTFVKGGVSYRSQLIGITKMGIYHKPDLRTFDAYAHVDTLSDPLEVSMTVILAAAA